LKDDEKKKLEEMKRELKKKQEEVYKLEKKVKDMEHSFSYEDKIGLFPGRTREILGGISRDDRLLVEEGGAGEVFYLDLYLIKDGEAIYIGSFPDYKDRYYGRAMGRRPSPKKEGPLRFVRNEVEPIREHVHKGTLCHRTWLLTGNELMIFKILMTDTDICRLYRMDGWQALEEYHKELGEMYEKRYPTLTLPSTPRRARTRRYRHEDMRQELMDYADENGLTLKEAVTALKLENQRFAERYDEVKRSIRKKMQMIEETFEGYITLDGPDMEGPEKEVG